MMKLRWPFRRRTPEIREADDRITQLEEDVTVLRAQFTTLGDQIARDLRATRAAEARERRFYEANVAHPDHHSHDVEPGDSADSSPAASRGVDPEEVEDGAREMWVSEEGSEGPFDDREREEEVAAVARQTGGYVPRLSPDEIRRESMRIQFGRTL